MERLLASPPMRFLTFPVIGSLLVATMPFFVYYTPWFEASMRSLPVYWLVHAVLLAVGLLFFCRSSPSTGRHACTSWR